MGTLHETILNTVLANVTMVIVTKVSSGSVVTLSLLFVLPLILVTFVISVEWLLWLRKCAKCSSIFGRFLCYFYFIFPPKSGSRN